MVVWNKYIFYKMLNYFILNILKIRYVNLNYCYIKNKNITKIINI